MATLSAGSSTEVALAVGVTLFISGGYGTAQIAPPAPPGAVKDILSLTGGEVAFGPYTVACTVNIVASSAIVYQTALPTDLVAVEYDGSGRQIFSASGVRQSALSSVTYDGSSRVSGYTLSGVAYVVAYPDSTTITVTGGGRVTTVTLDGSGRVIGKTVA